MTAGPGPLLKLENVHRSYAMGVAEVHALDGVSLAIDAGEYVAIMGPSGSGKSTLMHILGCLDRPSSGRYEVAGLDVARLTPDQLAGLRRSVFGFVFQRYNLLASATAEENVEVPAIYAGRRRSERRARARELLARLGLGDRSGHRPGELSGGQQQRVSIARALMNGAEVILADEPTGALDSQSGEDVLDLLDELHRQGKTIILITHEPDVAARAGRVITIRDGQIQEDTASGVVALAARRSETPPIELRSGTSWVDQVGEALNSAFRSLKVNLSRTILTLLGVMIGVAAVVTMLAIGDGSKARIVESIESMGTNLLFVRPGAPGTRTRGTDIATLVPEDAAAIAALDLVEAATPERQSRATVRAGKVDYRTLIAGAWPSFPVARQWQISEGSFFTEDDLERYQPVVVLGQTVADNLFPDGGSPIGQYVLVGNVPFEVIGVLKAKGASAWGHDMDDQVVIPLTTGFMRVFGQTFVSSIAVKVADKRALDRAEQEIFSLLLQRHRTEDFQIRNTAALVDAASQTQDTLTFLLASVAAISLFVGGIGVMNIMLVTVMERTREIGVRMATGARMSDIMMQFNIESLVVCAIGGIVGVGLGLGAAMAVSAFGMRVAIEPLPSILAFSCALATGLVFGYLPAHRAAKLDPVLALTTE